MEPTAPPPWLMFVVMVVAVSAFIAVLFVIKAATAGVRRLTDPDLRTRARSASVRAVRQVANAVRERSPQQNAENATRSGVQAFAEGSPANVPAPPQPTPDLPASVEELQRLAHAIALYAKRPNKELAILEAWGATKGEGPEYQRASRLFDAAMSDVARAAARQKPAAPAAA